MKRHIAIIAIALAAFFGPALTPPATAEEVASNALPKTEAGIAARENGDHETAARIFKHQAAKGDSEAQFELGMAYALGKGVEKDYVIAYMWTELATRQKEPYADFIRDEVAAKLTPAEIKEAKRRANAWMRGNGK